MTWRQLHGRHHGPGVGWGAPFPASTPQLSTGRGDLAPRGSRPCSLPRGPVSVNAPTRRDCTRQRGRGGPRRRRCSARVSVPRCQEASAASMSALCSLNGTSCCEPPVVHAGISKGGEMPRARGQPFPLPSAVISALCVRGLGWGRACARLRRVPPRGPLGPGEGACLRPALGFFPSSGTRCSGLARGPSRWGSRGVGGAGAASAPQPCTVSPAPPCRGPENGEDR